MFNIHSFNLYLLKTRIGCHRWNVKEPEILINATYFTYLSGAVSFNKQYFEVKRFVLLHKMNFNRNKTLYNFLLSMPFERFLTMASESHFRITMKTISCTRLSNLYTVYLKSYLVICLQLLIN